ncbi:MAG: Nudix family hydrolase [Gammaproteobacteria bacterium]|nr:Nudix family hydrolase [Gammaproteobacteria bacterium]
MPSTEAESIINVAVGVLEDVAGRVLIGQRAGDRPYSGLWEFPGGKLEPGESVTDALAREYQEELGVQVHTSQPLLSFVFAYPEYTVRLHVLRITKYSGEPRGLEGQAIDWVALDQLGEHDMLVACPPIIAALSLPRIYAITAASVMGEEAMLRGLERQLKKGLKLVQVREKKMDSQAYEQFATEVIHRCHEYSAKVLLNGEVDLVEGLGADGLHLDGPKLDAMGQRPIADSLWLSASCHNEAELAKACALGVDFAVLSPVLPTQTHPGAKTLGWEGFHGLIKDIPMPVYALGGMSTGMVEQAQDNGAQGVAMMRGLWEEI